MTIVESVTRAINEGDDSLWAEYVRRGWLHSLHVEISGPDGWDHRNYRRLIVHDYSSRMALRRYERGDGTFKSMLIAPPWWVENRREGERLGPEFRRSAVTRMATLQNRESVNRPILQESENVNQPVTRVAAEVVE